MVNDAIENNRIEVYYQPIYSTEKHIFTSAEALVRIRDDKGKIIPPATFIEIAERNGTILKLGEIILTMSVLLLRQVMCFNTDWNILKSTYP